MLYKYQQFFSDSVSVYLQKQPGLYHQRWSLIPSAILRTPTGLFSGSALFVAFYMCIQNTTSTCVHLEKGKLSDVGGFAVNGHLGSSGLSDLLNITGKVFCSGRFNSGAWQTTFSFPVRFPGGTCSTTETRGRVRRRRLFCDQRSSYLLSPSVPGMLRQTLGRVPCDRYGFQGYGRPFYQLFH